MFGLHRIRGTLGMLSAAGSLVWAGSAEAHVKWFCAFSVAGQPATLSNVLCQDFELLCLLSVAGLVMGMLIDGSAMGDALNRALDRAFALIAIRPDICVRAGVGMLMVAAWTLGGVIMTPELTTTSTFIPWVQLAIAACLADRRTLPLAAAGIVGLFGTAVYYYGVFHLADYPVFLGIAAFLAAIGLNTSIFGARPLDVLRWSLAITLMWASVEKWAYPQWTYPLFIQHPAMTMGFSPAFYMRAAGAVEFALAFALVLTPFTRRIAAVMLAAIFLTAIPGFGKIDAIGHAGVIGALFALMMDDAKRRPSFRQTALVPIGFGSALALFIGFYYVAHAALYGTAVV